MFKLSNYFTLEELLFSKTAARYGIDNFPGRGIIGTLISTAEKMDKIRDLLGHPILVSSGYRSPELNKKVGSSPSSQHTKGQAVDFICPRFGTPRKIVEAIIKSGIEFDQLILEFNSWVHISFVDSGSRNQALIIDKQGTRTYA